jgi:DNA-binding transcriptional regulator YdaS (Cro superfamily)
MKLRIYLWKNKLKVSDFAKKINYSPEYVREIVRGNKIPGAKAAKLIEEATNGEILAEDLMNGIF